MSGERSESGWQTYSKSHPNTPSYPISDLRPPIISPLTIAHQTQQILRQIVLVRDQERTHVADRVHVDDATALLVHDALVHDIQDLVDVEGIEDGRQGDVR